MSVNTRLLFLLVNYYNEKEVADFIETQLKAELSKIDIVIIDNGSNDYFILESLANCNEHIQLFKAGENLGYFGAANYGLNQYLVQNAMPAGVIVCNTDIVFKDQNYIPDLIKKIGDNGFDVLGPDITSALFGQKQNPYIKKRISKRKIKTLSFFTSNVMLYNAFLLLHYLLIKLKSIKRAGLINNRNGGGEIVYGVHGSFMVFNKTYFQKGADLNFPSFLFGEEIFVAEQCFKKGLITIYCPALKLIHNEHSTTGIFKSKLITFYLHQTYKYLLNSYER